MKSHLSAVAMLAVALLPPPSGVPKSLDPPELPEVSAGSWIVYDATADVVVASQEADIERPMASVTKVMTALVVREEADLDDRTRISRTAATVGESEVGLVEGEVWTIENLLQALLIRSGNDAAVALAEHVGGSVDAFAEMMNAKAAALGLNQTSFVNPHGLDDDDHFTTASDLIVMAKELMKDDVLTEIVRTRLITFKPDPSGVTRQARNTNRLLGVFPGVVGMKTGFTNQAQRVLISSHERNGRVLITVVMGSEDHFADSRELLAFGFGAETLQDRWLAPLLEEEGGGGALPLSSLDDAALARLERVMPLPDGRWATTRLDASGAARRIDRWLESIAPVLLGGER